LSKRWLRLVATVGAVGTLAVPLVASAAPEDYTISQYAAVNHPRGIAVADDGTVFAVDLGTGNNDGAILKLNDLDGNGMADNGAEINYAVTAMPSALMTFEEGNEVSGISDVALGADGEVYFVEGGFQVDPLSENHGTVWSTAAPNTSGNPLRTANPYASITAAEHTMNPDGGIVDSNPYALIVDDEGNTFVNDAGANATFKVDADGVVSVYAVYAPVDVPEDYELPFPVTDFVPTGLAMGPDGALYVSGLTGFPFSEGASMVYRLEDADGDGDVMEDGEMTVFAEGLSTSTALAFDNDGNLLATEFRSGLDPANPEMLGRVVMWADGEWDVVAENLITPTGLAVGPDGTIYVAQEFMGNILAIRPAAAE
jgi:streptogramin lyase